MVRVDSKPSSSVERVFERGRDGTPPFPPPSAPPRLGGSPASDHQRSGVCRCLEQKRQKSTTIFVRNEIFLSTGRKQLSRSFRVPLITGGAPVLLSRPPLRFGVEFRSAPPPGGRGGVALPQGREVSRPLLPEQRVLRKDARAEGGAGWVLVAGCVERGAGDGGSSGGACCTDIKKHTRPKLSSTCPPRRKPKLT